jgi:hypothetical protein
VVRGSRARRALAHRPWLSSRSNLAANPAPAEPNAAHARNL